MGHVGSGLGHSMSLTPQSHAGSPQASMSTIATHCSFVNIAAVSAWETGRSLFFPFYLFFFFFFFL